MTRLEESQLFVRVQPIYPEEPKAVFHSNSATETLALYLFVALLASCLLALGLLMMKSRAYRLPVAQGAGTLRSIAAWIRDPIWSAGLVVQTVGYALNIVALAGAPISMVSVMMQGGIALFVLLAVMLLGERARPREWAGIAITIIGMVILGASLSAGEKQTPTNDRAMVLLSIILVVVGFLPLRMTRLKQNSVGAAIFSGVIFGLASLYTKAMTDNYMTRSTIGLIYRIATDPYVYGVIVANIVGMVALQNSFFSARGVIAMPLSSALSNIVPIAGGIVVFGEGLPPEPTAATMRIAAFILTVLGSALLANAQEEVSSVDSSAQ
jgi:drug/metabolite transporter (DMT)-like permease